MNQEFNLTVEPWILAVTKQAKVDELSLTDVLLQCHKYVDLAGEMPAQDIAVLRVCLTVLSIFPQKTSSDIVGRG